GRVINRVHEGFYLDSVALMRIALELEAMAEVETAALMIGTPANLEILAAARLLTEAGNKATPRDLIIAIKLTNHADPGDSRDGVLGKDKVLEKDTVLERAEALLRQPAASTGQASRWRAKMLRSAVKSLPGANLALISVPGAYAAAEARKAMDAGLHVLIFSGNVPLEEEAALKIEARQRGLLVMGPDCGTALINGVAVAFANKVSRGNIGIVSASGTGLQEVSSLLTRMGGGISHGIGTGGRDLHEAVGGITTLMAIDALDGDPGTGHVVLISKPPAPSVARAVLERVAASPKPFTICLLGSESLQLPPNARQAFTLQQAAEIALGKALPPLFGEGTPSRQPPQVAPPHGVPPRKGWLRGLFTGGTLCAEAQTILHGAGLPLHSNVPVPGVTAYRSGGSAGHLLLDLGAEEYILGRLHPMIDPKPRQELLREALERDDVAAVLLDVVLGQGAHPNPAGGLASAVSEAGPDSPPVIASITGTIGDPQGWTDQVDTLRQAGVLVAPSNAAAANLALSLLKGN
ncbi:MAG: protein FdrA, partial [bacterium]